MPRPKSLIQAVHLHRASGQAVVYVNRQEIYLGPHGSEQSRKAYSDLLDRLQAGGNLISPKNPGSPKPGSLALNVLFYRFVTEELPRYSKGEQFCLKGVIKIARELFGDSPAAKFGPLRLRTVRDAMIENGWSRSYINHQIKRLRRVLRWGVSREIVPVDVMTALSTVEALKYGEAPGESRERRALTQDQIDAVRSELIARWRDPFDIMLLCGCRPGELLGLTTGMIDRNTDIWRVDLYKHKTAHCGKSRTLFFNAASQLILRKYLQADPEAKLFDMRLDSFSKAVRTACEIAFEMPVELRRPAKELTKAQRSAASVWRRNHTWTPYLLRHTAATRIADEMGTEVAQRL